MKSLILSIYANLNFLSALVLFIISKYSYIKADLPQALKMLRASWPSSDQVWETRDRAIIYQPEISLEATTGWPGMETHKHSSAATRLHQVPT
jgi:hypothetical protein